MTRADQILREMERGESGAMKLAEPFKGVVYDDAFKHACLKIIKPSLLKDVKEMTHGRAAWRRASVVSETLGKLSSASATVLAFASAADLADSTSHILGFVSGSLGTISMVLILFANFSRAQSIERSDALNLILTKAELDPIPEISRELLVNDDTAAPDTDDD
jgi:hypothetical protein